MDRRKTVCFSGHRSEKMHLSAEDMEKLHIRLYNEIDQAVDNGYDTFLFGACCGFDLLCAEMVLLCQKVKKASGKRIRLIAAVPFTTQSSNLDEERQKQYQDILAMCDKIYHPQAVPLELLLQKEPFYGG